MNNFTLEEKLSIMDLILLCRADVEVRDFGLLCQVNGFISVAEINHFIAVTDYNYSPEYDDGDCYYPEMTQFVIPYTV